MSRSAPFLVPALAALPLLTAPHDARACGCLSPPEVTEGEYGVNQQAEQIIFEVGDGTVTAHVLIRYAGEPDQFAWIVPVPNQPTLGLSETGAFALLDPETAPVTTVSPATACPDPRYVCEHQDDCYGGGGVKFDAGAGGTSGGGGTGGGGGPPGGVDVLDMQVVGSYETVTFAATDADLAVQWLQDNGFVVNDTTTPYMQPYIDAGMVFVAAKLVAGAGVDEIRPLKMTYQGDKPMIPLQLTAVAAEPHLTVTAYIYGDSLFTPVDHPVTTVDPERLSTDASGRVNYPMLLARTIDEAGGDAFVTEFAGAPPYPNQSNDPSFCCTDAGDLCGVGGDMACQCPGTDFDATDCAAFEGVQEGGTLLMELRDKYSSLTRLTTRLSPEEMTFDPMFQPGDPLGPSGRLVLQGSRYTLDGCRNDILDLTASDAVEAISDCASVYCGAGTCVPTDKGVGCSCDAGHVARTFTDLDGEPSVTCVPATPPVDLSKDAPLPDACAGVLCGSGTCVDLNGFAACACDGTAAAVLRADENTPIPMCAPITQLGSGPGAENYTTALLDVKVCAPPPPSCGENGWLVPNPNIQRQGITCESSTPDPADMVPLPPPDCDGTGSSGTGGEPGGSGGSGGSGGPASADSGVASCSCRSGAPTPGWLGGLALLALATLRRRR